MNPEPVSQSSLKLVFGHCDYWYLNNGHWESSNQGFSYFQKQETQKTALSLFWRNLSNKIFQLDNFQYDGIASIQFEPKISKFKINFNPRLFYEYIMYSLAKEAGITDIEWGKTPFKEIASKIEEIANKLSPYGWDLSLYNKLSTVGWNDEECWKQWNNLIFRNKYVFECLIYIFLHEMMHLMWHHVKRMGDSEDKNLFNKAADLSINQTLPLPMPLKKRLISQFSTFFWPEAQYAFLKYFIKNDLIDVPKKVRKILTSHEIFVREKDKFDLDKIIDFNENKHIRGKNADFYYNVLKESHGKKTPNAPSNSFNWSSLPADNGSEMFEHPGSAPGGEGADGEKQEGEGQEGDGQGEGKSKKEQAGGVGGEDGLGNGDGTDSFEKQLEFIEANKIFRESYDKSEDKGKIRDETGGGKSEIPFSISLNERINEYVKTKKDNKWRKQFRQIMLRQINEKEKDITMTRSSRKRPDIFPGMKRDVGLDVVFIIDTSGSIRKSDYQLFLSEIQNVGKLCDLSNCRIIQCHTSVSADDKKFSLKKIKKIQFKETGGTRMRTALEMLVQEKNKRPVIIFTDGLIDYFSAEEFKFEIVLFVTVEEQKITLERRGFTVICPKLD